MKKYNFNIGNQNIELDEKDLIFGYMFNTLNLPIHLKTIDYQSELQSITKYDTQSIKQSLNKISKQQSLTDYEEQNISDFYGNYICNATLFEICADIKEILVNAVDEIASEFDEYNNHGITIINIVDTIMNEMERLQKEYYNYSVSKGRSKYKGLSFEESLYNTDDEIFAYSIKVSDSYNQNEYEGSKENDGFLAKYGALYDDSFTTTGFVNYLYQGENAKQFFKIVERYEDPIVHRFTALDLREKCMVEILKIIENINKRYGIPLNLQYCKESNLVQFLDVTDRMDMEDGKKFLDGKINKVEYQNLCVQTLRSFPFITKGYMCAMVGCGCANGELEKMMSLVGMGNKLIESSKGTVFEVDFLSRIKYDINNEDEVNKAYEDLQKYKKYLNYDKCDDKERELLEQLLVFDKRHRTVNGKEYATLEEANEVRERSFDGREYDSKEQAQLVRNEVEGVRNAYNGKTLIEKYKAKERLSDQTWKTEEASQEMQKYEKEIEEEYLRLGYLGENVESIKKSMQIKGAVAIAGTVMLFFMGKIWGVIALGISGYIIYSDYKKYEESKNAKEMHALVQTFLKERDKKQEDLSYVATIGNGSQKIEKCVNCGNRIEEGMKFCTKCGMKLNWETDSNTGFKCPSCGTNLEEGMKFCTKCGTKLVEPLEEKNIAYKCPTCGAKLEEGMKFCTQCGQALKDTNGGEKNVL